LEGLGLNFFSRTVWNVVAILLGRSTPARIYTKMNKGILAPKQTLDIIPHNSILRQLTPREGEKNNVSKVLQVVCGKARWLCSWNSKRKLESSQPLDGETPASLLCGGAGAIECCSQKKEEN
jgi:hypothetical protein